MSEPREPIRELPKKSASTIPSKKIPDVGLKEAVNPHKIEYTPKPERFAGITRFMQNKYKDWTQSLAA